MVAMIAEIGHFSLVLLLLASMVQVAVPGIGMARSWSGWMKVAPPLSIVMLVLTVVSFAALTASFLRSDFSLALVVANSHSAKPLLYRFSGVWGNHEGSMLLWVLILTLFGALVGWRGRLLPPGLHVRALCVQAAITLAFTAYILFASNPFSRLEYPPFDGQDLNPLLQDPGLALHPPLLYLGYVGLSVSYSFAIAALLEGRVDAAWARWVRPWTLASWMFLTLGIAVGSWWAYYELGWGGWWFWDPVENASFMPWLAATALLHSASVVEKRECLMSWTVLLAILGFTLSLVGTFLVRSGIITSVHAFASDPTRGAFILAILAVFAGGGFLLYAIRSGSLVPSGAFSIVSRETALVSNNLLLVVAMFVVFIGTFWPLFMEMFYDRSVSVGPPFFNIAFTPFVTILVALLPFGAIMTWKRASLAGTARRLWLALAISIASGSISWAVQTGDGLLAPLGLTLASWLVLGAVADLWHRAGSLRGGTKAFGRRLLMLNGADWGRCIAHAGLGISVAGMTVVTAWEVEDIRVAVPGDSFNVGSYHFEFVEVGTRRGPNYSALYGEFDITADERRLTRLRPERRHYEVAGSQTTEAAIDMGLFRDIYMVIGEIHEGGGMTVKTYVKPLVNWIWLGAVMMALGGVASLLDRRYRVARLAPKRLASASGVQA